MTSLRRDFAADSRLLRTAALAVAIGVCSSLAAYLLLELIHFFTNLFFYQRWSFAATSPAENRLGAWVIVVPAIGGLLIGLIARFGSDKIRGHGIPEAIEIILFGKSRMSSKVAVLKPLSSGIAIGSGGPFGAEGPIIMTGGALGSLIAQYFHLSAAERKTLLVAGATAGMTAVFGTPVAAVLLAVELLLFELRPRSLLPVIIACAMAAFMRPLLLDPGPLFPLQTAAVDIRAALSCIVAGLIAGALSAALSSALYKVEDLFGKLPVHWMWWPALGGIVVGIGGLLQPRTLGVGYDVINDLLHAHLALSVALAILVVKAIIWVVALGSGTSGGVLAPLLMMGAGLGTLLAPVLPGGDALLWPLVCMAATLAGVLGTPLTATAFAFGLTQDQNILLPALLASVVSYGFGVLVTRRSIMTEKIARRGLHVHREYGVDPLERHVVDEVMTQDVSTIPADLPLPAAQAKFFGIAQVHRAYPVIDDGRLLGLLDRERMAAARGDALLVGDLFAPDADLGPLAYRGETCQVVATRLAVHGLERMPVVTAPESRELIGIISRSDLVKPSRAFFDEEQTHEKFRYLRVPAGRRESTTAPRRPGRKPR